MQSYFRGLPYCELMRLTLISSPFEAFATSIFFDQLPHFNSTESLKNKQEDVLLKGSVSLYIKEKGMCSDLVTEL